MLVTISDDKAWQWTCLCWWHLCSLLTSLVQKVQVCTISWTCNQAYWWYSLSLLHYISCIPHTCFPTFSFCHTPLDRWTVLSFRKTLHTSLRSSVGQLWRDLAEGATSSRASIQLKWQSFGHVACSSFSLWGSIGGHSVWIRACTYHSWDTHPRWCQMQLVSASPEAVQTQLAEQVWNDSYPGQNDCEFDQDSLDSVSCLQRCSLLCRGPFVRTATESTVLHSPLLSLVLSLIIQLSNQAPPPWHSS
jgi:hypothetical protein